MSKYNEKEEKQKYQKNKTSNVSGSFDCNPLILG
jgi:hypothetical protein